MRNNRHTLAAAAAISLFLTVSVPAWGTEKGWYLGGSIGQSEIVDPDEFASFCNSVFITCGDGDTDTAFEVFGGYQAGSFFGVELAFFDLGNPGVSVTAPVAANAEASMTGGTLSLLPQIPIGSVGAVFGRLGIAAGNVEVRAQVPTFGLVEDESSIGGTIVYGVGGALNLGERVTLRVDWRRYAFDETLNLAGVDVVTPDVDVIGASLIFRFPKN